MRFIIGGIAVLAIVEVVLLSSSDRLSGVADVVAGDLNQPTPTVEGNDPLQPSGSPPAVSNAPGIEAIPVTVPVDGAGNLGVPAFTEDEVRAYLEANPPADWDPTTPQPEIISIQFLFTNEAAAAIDHSIPRGPEDLLCIVTVRGTFVPQLPPGATPVSTTDEESIAVIIFDAITDNLLGQGYLREP